MPKSSLSHPAAASRTRAHTRTYPPTAHPLAPGHLPTYSSRGLFGEQCPHGTRALPLAEPEGRQRRSVMSRWFGLIHSSTCPECTNHSSGAALSRGSAASPRPHPSAGGHAPTTCSSSSTWTLRPQNPEVKEPAEEANGMNEGSRVGRGHGIRDMSVKGGKVRKVKA